MSVYFLQIVSHNVGESMKRLVIFSLDRSFGACDMGTFCVAFDREGHRLEG